MGILFLADDAGIGCANWVLRAIVSDLAPVLIRDGAPELAAWLTSEVSPVELYGHFDVRELTAANQRAFRNALGPAFAETKSRGPVDWSDLALWPGYLRLFESLAEQALLLSRGEKPTALPNLSAVPDYDGKFTIVREEENFIDKDSAKKMSPGQLRAVAGQYGCEVR